ncbi:MAG: CapA family protein [Firmicutes bacterium]|nr:CapA family protein [Bacillota bacterium]
MQSKGLHYIKQSRVMNMPHLRWLLIILIISSVAVVYLEKQEERIVFSARDNSSLTITVGGNLYSFKQQNIPFSRGLGEIFNLSDVNLLSLTTPIFRDMDDSNVGHFIIELLEKYSINLVQISDQQFLSFGVTGLLDTVNALGQQGIDFIGAGLNEVDAVAPVYFHGKEIALGVLAVNASPPLGWAAGVNRFGVATFGERHDEAITEAKLSADIVIALVSFPEDILEERKKELGMALVDKGVHIVVGTGSGPVGKVEYYRDSVIFYNIGTLWSQEAVYSYERESVVLQVVVSAEGNVVINAIPVVGNGYSCKVLNKGFLYYKISRRLGGQKWELKL